MSTNSVRSYVVSRARAWNLVLVPVALGYIGYVSWRHLGELQTIHLEGSDFTGFLLLAAGSILLSTLYHVRFVAALTPSVVDARRLALAYSVGQIVRYLPGKVMGLVFQANYLRDHVPAKVIAIALLVQMLLTYFCAGVLAAALLVSHALESAWPLLGVVPAAALVWFAHRNAWAERALRSAPYFGKRLLDVDSPARSAAATNALTILLLVNWLPFLAGWVWLLRAGHSTTEALTFAAAYLAASIASTALIVVPSGIVVREAIFVWIGARAGLPVSQLLLYAVLARLALTGADILSATLLWCANAIRPHGRLPG
jgi:hypothetical protein